jgi:hypothetical protein
MFSAMRHALPVALPLAFLLATNSYYSVASDKDLIGRSAGDVWSYLAIAEAAPRLPAGQVPYHHAQRFVLPYLAGLIADALGVPCDWVMRALAIIVLLVSIQLTDRFAVGLGCAPRVRLVLTSLVFLNPYAARMTLAFPFMVNDLGFGLGLVLAFSGLVLGFPGRIVLGSLVAILCRQTAVVFALPLAWFFLAGTCRRLAMPKERFAAVASALVVIVGYHLTGLVAATFSERSQNLTAVSNLFSWWVDRFDLQLLVLELGARGAAAWAVTAAGLWLLVPHLSREYGRDRDARTTLCAVVLVAVAALTVLQPILGGPEAGNFPRLSVLGLWPLVFGVLLWTRRRRHAAPPPMSPPMVAVLGVVLAFHSLHHVYSWPGRVILLGDPRWFFGLQLTLCGALLIGRIAASHRKSS